MSASPQQFDKVSVVCKANVYFGGKVVSHVVLFPDGSKKTLGLIYPGDFTFDTGKPEIMEIIAGSCRVKVKGATAWTTYSAGTSFQVPGNSAYDISVADGVTEYICYYC